MSKSASARSIHLLRSPHIDGVGIFCITEKGKSTYYMCQEVPCEIGGRGFAVHRLDRDELYHVRIGKPVECSCECLGFLRHGHCKHIRTLLILERFDLI